MGKGIIIIETGEIPKDCQHCNQPDSAGFCGWVGAYIDTRVNLGEKHSCCPIQPMPQKKKKYGIDARRVKSYKNGWNACVDEMMGGSDG